MFPNPTNFWCTLEPGTSTKKSKRKKESRSIKWSTMPKKPGELKQKVLRRVKKETLAAITKYVLSKQPKLWGLKKKGQFISNSIVVALYKDLTGQGYNSLHDEVRPWLGVSAKSLQHNTKVLRQVMAKWGRRQIKRGRQEAWKRAGVQVRRPKWLEKVNLTMDSTDLKKEWNPLLGCTLVSFFTLRSTFCFSSPGFFGIVDHFMLLLSFFLFDFLVDVPGSNVHQKFVGFGNIFPTS
ncbi:hypothetical protein QOT17_006430 [Balamuthia mandrillaris]